MASALVDCPSSPLALLAFPDWMRLLYLIDDLRFRGGTEHHLWELSHGLAARGHQVTVLSLLDGAYGDTFAASPAIQYECLRVNRVYGPSGWAGFYRLATLMRRFSPQVVQTFHSGSDLMGPLAAAVACPGARRISSRRDLGYTKSPAVTRVQRWVNRAVHLVLGNSREVTREAMRREGLPAHKTRVLYNGIDVAAFAALPVPRREPRVVGTVANLRRVKGVHHLLKAIQLLAGSPEPVELRVAGDGEERDALAALAGEYGITRRVTFLGTVGDVAGFLSGVDLYVQPSLEEGFSNSVLEAMAAALPVIATDVGGNRDILESGVDGLLVAPDDPVALAESIRSLLADGERRHAFGLAARRKILADFTVTHMLDEYERLYQEPVS